jgi:hypothetical protein
MPPTNTDEMFANMPRRGAYTDWSVDSGVGQQWNRLAHLASDDAALERAIDANGFNLQQQTLRKLGM